MNDVLKIINTLSETSSRNAKINLIVEALDSDVGELFYKVCSLALNPFNNFGVKTQIPTYIDHTNEVLPLKTLVNRIERDVMNRNSSNALIETITDLMNHSTSDDWDIIARVLLKDLKCGMQAASFNAALNKLKNRNEKFTLIPEYPCMLVSSDFDKFCGKVDDWNDYVVQEKCDGLRCNIIVKTESELPFKIKSIEFRGRSGKSITVPNPEFLTEVERFANKLCQFTNPRYDNEWYYKDGFVIDGELLVYDEEGVFLPRQIGNGIINKAVRGTISEEESDYLCLIAWDIFPIEMFEGHPRKSHIEHGTYGDRLKYLEKVFDGIPRRYYHINLIETKPAQSKENVLEQFQQKILEGKEGVIVKSLANTFKDTRVTDCVKLKAELECDLKIVGIEKGTKGSQFENDLGAIICESSDSKVRVSVGTGFSQDQRKQLINEDLVGKIASIVYNARIKDRNREEYDSLFLPRFMEIRSDKDLADSSENIK